MLINSLDQMETIVENNKSLDWDGWTVLENRTNENGSMHRDGAYVKGKWIIQKRYEPTSLGWEIPGKFVG